MTIKPVKKVESQPDGDIGIHVFALSNPAVSFTARSDPRYDRAREDAPRAIHANRFPDVISSLAAKAATE
jgi:hypothetical protein